MLICIIFPFLPLFAISWIVFMRYSCALSSVNTPQESCLGTVVKWTQSYCQNSCLCQKFFLSYYSQRKDLNVYVSFLLSDTIIDNKILFAKIKFIIWQCTPIEWNSFPLSWFILIKQEIDYFTVITNNLSSVMIVTS